MSSRWKGSLEEQLLSMFSSIGFQPLQNMIRELEIGALRSMQQTIDQMITQLNVNATAAMPPGNAPAANLNPFTILEIGPNCTEDELRKAYRRKCVLYHPDKGGSDNEMKLVNAAYEAIMLFKGWHK